MQAYYLLAIVVLLLVIFAGIYNGHIARRNAVRNVFASLDALLQKRYDLIPNLVSAVQGYMAHERDVLENVVRLRNAVGQSASSRDRSAASEQLGAALQQVFALAEGYPELKANQQFLYLQAALCEVEEQISAARRAYNAAVTDYNNGLQMFPSSIVANMMGLQNQQWFQITDTERQNPDISGALHR